MMDTPALLATCRARDIRLSLDADRLRLSAPPGAIDGELKQVLASRKQELIDYLRRISARKGLPADVVPVKADGSRPAIFAVSGHGGDVFWLRGMSRALDPDQPLLGIQPPGLDGSAPLTTIEALAAHELELIRRVQPEGPYLIAGHCAGGTLAFEVAQQLVAQGQKVSMLALIGCPYPAMFKPMPQMMLRMRRRLQTVTSGSWMERRQYLASRLRNRISPPPAPPLEPAALHRARVEAATVAAAARYKPRVYPGTIDLFVTADNWHRSDIWRARAAACREHIIPGFEIGELLLGPHAHLLGELLQHRLDEISSKRAPSA